MLHESLVRLKPACWFEFPLLQAKLKEASTNDSLFTHWGKGIEWFISFDRFFIQKQKINHEKVINFQESGGKEMKTWIKFDGKCEFQEDLSEWARKFLNARPHNVNIAGKVKLRENTMDEIMSEDENSMDIFESSQASTVEEMDTLERLFERKRIYNSLYKQVRFAGHSGPDV